MGSSYNINFKVYTSLYDIKTQYSHPSDLKVGEYPVMEQFYTIQGEGFWAGTAAYFIRLAGCDVGCSWCDVKESWSTDDYPVVSSTVLLAKVSETNAKHVVITGGEPAIYDLSPLVDSLSNTGLKVHVETSGVYEVGEGWHWICVSPKKFKEPLLDSLKKADELKVIVVNKTDFDFAELHAKNVKSSCKLYLQPEWSKKEKVSELIVDYVKANPQWNISVQTHKYLNIP